MDSIQYKYDNVMAYTLTHYRSTDVFFFFKWNDRLPIYSIVVASRISIPDPLNGVLAI